MFRFRPYQQEIIEEGSKRLASKRILLLAMEVRTGKTLTAFGIAEKLGFSKVLFITKKKIITSKTITNDYELLNPLFSLKMINYASLHKLEDPKSYDLIIIDESHSIGAYPKPSKRTQRLKHIVGNTSVILLSGTPTPESWSQIYHQFWISNYSPFKAPNFYSWAQDYVSIEKRFIAHGNQVNDYSNANQRLIKNSISSYMISYSQKQAGFTSSVTEEILYVPMQAKTYEIIEELENNLVVRGQEDQVILADTPVKLMQKVHQLYSGTVKMEDGITAIIDDSKAVYIQSYFKDKKIAIFYKFKEELKLLQSVFGETLTIDIDEFNNTPKNIALQIVSGREGISLKKADTLVFYNIDFSATSYWQARDRLTTKNRKHNTVYWIFAKGGLEKNIYKRVQAKKSFTLNHYERIKAAKQPYQNA